MPTTPTLGLQSGLHLNSTLTARRAVPSTRHRLKGQTPFSNVIPTKAAPCSAKSQRPCSGLYDLPCDPWDLTCTRPSLTPLQPLWPFACPPAPSWAPASGPLHLPSPWPGTRRAHSLTFQVFVQSPSYRSLRVLGAPGSLNQSILSQPTFDSALSLIYSMRVLHSLPVSSPPPHFSPFFSSVLDTCGLLILCPLPRCQLSENRDLPCWLTAGSPELRTVPKHCRCSAVIRGVNDRGIWGLER